MKGEPCRHHPSPSQRHREELPGWDGWCHFLGTADQEPGTSMKASPSPGTARSPLGAQLPAAGWVRPLATAPLAPGVDAGPAPIPFACRWKASPDFMEETWTNFRPAGPAWQSLQKNIWPLLFLFHFNQEFRFAWSPPGTFSLFLFFVCGFRVRCFPPR